MLKSIKRGTHIHIKADIPKENTLCIYPSVTPTDKTSINIVPIHAYIEVKYALTIYNKCYYQRGAKCGYISHSHLNRQDTKKRYTSCTRLTVECISGILRIICGYYNTRRTDNLIYALFVYLAI